MKKNTIFKNILAVTLAVVMLLSITACGKRSGKTISSGTLTQMEEDGFPTYLIPDGIDPTYENMVAYFDTKDYTYEELVDFFKGEIEEHDLNTLTMLGGEELYEVGLAQSPDVHAWMYSGYEGDEAEVYISLEERQIYANTYFTVYVAYGKIETPVVDDTLPEMVTPDELEDNPVTE